MLRGHAGLIGGIKMTRPLAGLVGAGCSIVVGTVMGVWFRALAQADNYMPGLLYFLWVPYGLALLAGLVLELSYRPRFGIPQSTSAAGLGVVFPLGVILEICNALRLGPGNGEPYAGTFFWLSTIALYGVLGIFFGLGLTEATESRRRHGGGVRQIREIEKQLVTLESEIRRRERELEDVSGTHSAHAELDQGINSLIRTDPANLEVAQRQIANRLGNLSTRDLVERSVHLSDDLRTQQQRQEELADRVQDAENALSQKAAQLRAAERELARVAADDQANARIVVDRLKEAWAPMTLDELAQQATPGIVAPLCMAVRSAELQIKSASEACAPLRGELEKTSAASLATRLELLLCRKEHLIREAGPVADPEDTRRRLRDLAERREALRNEANALRAASSQGTDPN